MEDAGEDETTRWPRARKPGQAGRRTACSLPACRITARCIERALPTSEPGKPAMGKLSDAMVGLAIAGLFTGNATAQEVFSLKIACVLDAQHPLMVAGRRMAEVAERQSNGRVKFTLYPSSQLGGQRE